MKKSGIYQIRNLINKKVYIGSAIDIKKRWNMHLLQLRRGDHHSSHLQNAWNKHGESNFMFEILEEVIEKTDLLSREQFYLDFIKPWDRNLGYNICVKSNSPLGLKRSDEAKYKMRMQKLGKTRKPHSEESKKLIRESQEGEKGYWYGKQPLLGFIHTQETKDALCKKFSKSIIQYSLNGDFLKEWDSAIEVQRTLFLGKSTIGKCCRGIYTHAYGYIWKFKNND